MKCSGEVVLDNKTVPDFIIVTCPICGIHYLVKEES